MAGLRLAARLGFRAVEFDVMLTADGVPILIHDETLERTTNGRGRVEDQDWAAISRLDAGAGFHPAWAGEPVPRLGDALALARALGLAVNVEIKPSAGREEETGRVVAEVVGQSWPLGRGMLLSSFSEAALAMARQAAPGLPRALLADCPGRDVGKRLAALGCQALHIRAASLDRPQLAELARAGMPVAAYTINGRAEADQCFRLGMAAVFTDRLDCLGPR